MMLLRVSVGDIHTVGKCFAQSHVGRWTWALKVRVNSDADLVVLDGWAKFWFVVENSGFPLERNSGYVNAYFLFLFLKVWYWTSCWRVEMKAGISCFPGIWVSCFPVAVIGFGLTEYTSCSMLLVLGWLNTNCKELEISEKMEHEPKTCLLHWWL